MTLSLELNTISLIKLDWILKPPFANVAYDSASCKGVTETAPKAMDKDLGIKSGLKLNFDK